LNSYNSNKDKTRILGVILLVYFFLGLLFALPVEALRLETTWGERVDLSEKIVRGQVVLMRSYWNHEKMLIHTDVKLLIDEYLKGEGPKELTITIPGGTVGEITQWVSDTPQFHVGDYGIIFLNPSGQVTGGPDGVYLLEGKGGERFLLWLRAYITGDPNAQKEGPIPTQRLLSK
jgi:hypothetical protein